MHHDMTMRAGGFEQPLHAGNDLLVHLLAGEGITGPRPGVGEIHADDGRLASEADATLEAARLIDAGALVERLLQDLV